MPHALTPKPHRLSLASVALTSLFLLAGCRTELMPTPNLCLKPNTDTFAHVPPALQTNTVDLFYVTDRKPVPRQDGVIEYGWERSPAVAFGSCQVEIGHNLTWDQLVKNSTTRKRSVSLPLTVQKVIPLGTFPPTPYPLIRDQDKIVVDPAVLAQADDTGRQLQQEIRRRLALTPRKEVFIFVHGNFHTFDQSAFILAGLWHFLGREGVPIIYTWPAGSPGNISQRYNHDRESGQFTVYHLRQFLNLLTACPELEKIHIVSHSWGTFVATSALREMFIATRAAGKDPRTELKIGNVVLAAPDIDLDVAMQRLATEQFYAAIDRGTIYASRNDKLLGAADIILASERRVGQLSPADLPAEFRNPQHVFPTQIVDARVTSNLFGHNYFYTSPAVSSDLILLLRDNHDPGAANGRPLKSLGQNFWFITDDYLKK